MDDKRKRNPDKNEKRKVRKYIQKYKSNQFQKRESELVQSNIASSSSAKNLAVNVSAEKNLLPVMEKAISVDEKNENEPLFIEDKNNENELIFFEGDLRNVDSEEENIIDEDICTEAEDLDFIIEAEYKTLFVDDLRDWFYLYKIKRNALDGLLKILRKHKVANVPKDSRTVIKIPSEKVAVIPMQPSPNGQYWHLGIRTIINTIFISGITIPNTINLSLNIDGLPIVSKGSSQFWPILCHLDFVDLSPMVIGVYFGDHKPKNVEEYLNPMIIELQELYKDGFLLDDRKVKVQISKIICDAPAVAMIKAIKGHNGYYGCGKCYIEGVNSDHANKCVCFPGPSWELRTNESFRQKTQEKHHLPNITSPFAKLPIDMIKAFPLDYMHLICLGIVKKLLIFWTVTATKNKRSKLSYQIQDKISAELIKNKPKFPKEFHRQPRPLNTVRDWKATEFRNFLLYSGPVVLFQNLEPAVYQNFLDLHVAVTICISQKFECFYDTADLLLKQFVAEFTEIYGKSNVSYNVHNCLHLIDDVRLFGPLDEFAAFPFESKLGHLKKLLCTGVKPLQQLAKNYFPQFQRQVEIKAADLAKNNEFKAPVIISSTKVQFSNFVLEKNEKDVWFMTKSYQIIEFCRVNLIENNIKVYGYAIINKDDFYTQPIPSSFLHIYKSDGTRNSDQISVNSNDILCKLICLEKDHDYDQSTFFVFFPVNHTFFTRKC